MIDNILQRKVSWFEKVNQIDKPSLASIGDLLEGIRVGGNNGLLAQNVSIIRNATEQKERNNLKATLLPVITWQGTFSYKSKMGLKSLSGVMCIDIDHQPFGELLRIQNILSTLPWVLAYFRSPSGDGLKVLVKAAITTPQEYECCYAQIIDTFTGKYSCQVDKSCLEYSKGCYASYDPGLYINTNVEDFPFHYDVDSFVWDNSTVPKRSTTSIVGNSNFVVPQPTPTEDFLNKLQAQRNGLSDDQIIGILDRLFHRFPQNYVDSHRTNSIFVQATKLCRAGIQQDKALTYLRSQFLPTGYDEWKLLREVTKAYLKSSEAFGSERGSYKMKTRE